MKGRRTVKESNLFEQMKNMPVRELADYVCSFQVYVKKIDSKNGDRGMLINFLDQEKSTKNVKVLINGDIERWTEAETKFVRAESRARKMGKGIK